MKSDLEVGDWVFYKNEKYQVGVINGDNTIRLKTDNKTHPNYDNGTIGCFHRNNVIKFGEMISTAQLQSLEFEYNNELERYEYKDVSLEFNALDSSEMVVKIQDFQLYGIRDVRDLRKLIELVYGS